MKQIYLLLTLTLFSCHSETSNIKGFWIGGLPDIEGQFYTYEIKDSSVIINRFSINGYEEFGLYNNNNLSLPLGYRSFDFTDKYDLLGDTLILIDSANPKNSIKLVRSDPEFLGQKKYFTSMMIDLELDTTSFGTPYESLRQNKFLSHINFGWIKSYYSKRYPLDSVFIQVNDVFINTDDISKWIEIELERTEHLNKELGIALNIDKNVSKKVKENLVYKIHNSNNSIPIYIGGIDPESKELTYRQIKNAP